MMTNINKEDFWKPIEQCPKEENVFYFIKFGENTFAAAEYYENSWIDYSADIVMGSYHVTHFAEIPPCEVQS